MSPALGAGRAGQLCPSGGSVWLQAARSCCRHAAETATALVSPWFCRDIHLIVSPKSNDSPMAPPPNIIALGVRALAQEFGGTWNSVCDPVPGCGLCIKAAAEVSAAMCVAGKEWSSTARASEGTFPRASHVRGGGPGSWLSHSLRPQGLRLTLSTLS